MRRRILGAACLIGLAFAAAASAQGTDDTVLLRYRFQPGQEFHYHLTLNSDMTMSFAGITPPPGASMPGRMPMTISGTYELSQKVKSVTPDGTATVTVGVDKMDLNTSMMGMNITARLAPDGKLETLMNGRPMPVPSAANAPLSHRYFDVTIDPTGKTTGLNPEVMRAMSQVLGGQNAGPSLFPGLPGIGGLAFPEKPVKPGDTWETKTELTVPIPALGPPGAGAGGTAAAGTISVNYAMQNKLLRVENGQAVIESRVTISMPPGSRIKLPTAPGAPPGMQMSFQKMEQTGTATQRYQVEPGTLDGSDSDVRLAMTMAVNLPPGMRPGAAAAAPPAGGAARSRGAKPGAASYRPGTTAASPPAAPRSLQISLDGTMKMKMERIDAVSPPLTAPAAPPTGP
jgi:hypothetical protein